MCALHVSNIKGAHARGAFGVKINGHQPVRGAPVTEKESTQRRHLCCNLRKDIWHLEVSLESLRRKCKHRDALVSMAKR